MSKQGFNPDGVSNQTKGPKPASTPNKIQPVDEGKSGKGKIATGSGFMDESIFKGIPYTKPGMSISSGYPTKTGNSDTVDPKVFTKINYAPAIQGNDSMAAGSKKQATVKTMGK
jgi:hypothetical protein